MLANAKFLAADHSLEDQAIIKRVLAGHTDDYEILIRRYNSMMYKSARGILKEEEDIEDVMQEAYIRGFEKLAQFRQEAKFSTWLTRILINCALQHAGKSQKHPSVSLEALQEDDLLTEKEFQEEESSAFDSAAVRGNLQKAIEGAITQLPTKYRVVFIMREVEQMSVRDTAQALDISEENVKVRLHRARLLLKDMLSAEVRSLEIFEFHDTRCTMIATAVMTRIHLMLNTPGCRS
jgi:RNA polymerase sigma factor (sigma-70 family)